VAGRQFQVTPLRGHARLFAIAIAALPLILIVGLLPALPAAERRELVELWPVLAIALLLAPLLMLAMFRRAVLLEDGMLVVKAALHTRRVPLAALAPERARIVDLDERTGLRPLLKTWGMALPGFHAGWFRQREGLRKVFCLLTDRRRVLWLPVSGGPDLMLSLERPQALLDAIAAQSGVAPAARRR
jgi:hypothetical protein